MSPAADEPDRAARRGTDRVVRRTRTRGDPADPRRLARGTAVPRTTEPARATRPPPADECADVGGGASRAPAPRPNRAGARACACARGRRLPSTRTPEEFRALRIGSGRGSDLLIRIGARMAAQTATIAA